MKLLTIIGTRPEAVKMAPVLRVLTQRTDVRSLIASTGQHRDLVDDPLRFFGLAADFDLKLMEPRQEPGQLLVRALAALGRLLEDVRPDRVIVQGDTTTARAGAEAAFLRGIPVSHVEAGLRTYGDLPWPEETFRREIDIMADQLFAPTPYAARNLAAERLGGTVHVTGNSGIDALHHVVRTPEGWDADLPPLGSRPLILATLHRRENVGAGTAELCAALTEVAGSGLADVALPVHPNPEIGRQVRAALGSGTGIDLLPPQPYPTMVRLMQRAALILTDSGGIQEEAPSLGKPVLVLRDATERPEGVAAGLAALVGCDRRRILSAVQAMLDRGADDGRIQRLANPYGDGQAAGRIVAGLLGEPFAPFQPEPLPAAIPLRAVM